MEKFKDGLMYKLDLQFFADSEEVTEEETTEDTTVDKEVTKTFTQEEVNAFVAKEKRLAQERLLKEAGFEDFENAKEGVAKFKEWQESQKTEAQRQAEELENARKQLEQFNSEKFKLEAQLEALKAGANQDSLEDVILLAKAKVSDDVSIAEAIKQTLEKYPQFGNVVAEKKPAPSFTNGNHTPPDGGKDDPFAAALARLKL